MNIRIDRETKELSRGCKSETGAGGLKTFGKNSILSMEAVCIPALLRLLNKTDSNLGKTSVNFMVIIKLNLTGKDNKKYYALLESEQDLILIIENMHFYYICIEKVRLMKLKFMIKLVQVFVC